MSDSTGDQTAVPPAPIPGVVPTPVASPDQQVVTLQNLLAEAEARSKGKDQKITSLTVEVATLRTEIETLRSSGITAQTSVAEAKAQSVVALEKVGVAEEQLKAATTTILALRKKMELQAANPLPAEMLATIRETTPEEVEATFSGLMAGLQRVTGGSGKPVLFSSPTVPKKPGVVQAPVDEKALEGELAALMRKNAPKEEIAALIQSYAAAHKEG